MRDKLTFLGASTFFTGDGAGSAAGSQQRGVSAVLKVVRHSSILCLCIVEMQLQCNSSTCSLQQHTGAPGTKTTPGVLLGLSLAAACRAQSRHGCSKLVVTNKSCWNTQPASTLPCQNCRTASVAAATPVYLPIYGVLSCLIPWHCAPPTDTTQ